MHDVMFSKEIIRVIKEKRRALPKGICITIVHVFLSPLCHVTSKSLSEAFKQMVGGTDMGEVLLDIKPLPVKMKCGSCKGAFTILEPAFSCPECGSSDITLNDNREFLIESLEVEEK